MDNIYEARLDIMICFAFVKISHLLLFSYYYSHIPVVLVVNFMLRNIK
jgi:hypothetical protein